MAPPRSDVVLVVPPMSHAGLPALGPSLLVASCRQRGLSALVLYANLRLAGRVGFDRYNRATLAFNEAMVGESLFRSVAFPDRIAGESADALLARRLVDSGRPRSPEEPLRFFATGVRSDVEAVTACAEQVAPFVESLVAELVALEPRVVGFSSVFQQTMASVALARRLKALRPDVVTVLGGPNAARPMGEALAELTGVFDHVFSGEADLAFPDFCAALLERGERPAARVVDCPPLEDLDRAAEPDYDDYFEQVAPLVGSEGVRPEPPLWLHLETSRGCWWGQRRPCAFCALNGRERSHRYKSAARVLGELRRLSTRYGARRVQITDNILPRRLARELLPMLAAAAEEYELFWEVRPDLGGDELDLLWAAGVRDVQPGIESLSTHVLRLLNKGTTGVRNLVFLRNCASRGIATRWNMLVRVPGESRTDYQAMIRLFPLLEHLRPPEGCGAVRVDRFSPYHARPADFGLSNVRPLPVYSELYPAGAPLADLAFHFLADYSTELFANADLLAELARAVERWMRVWSDSEPPPKLAAVALDRGLVLVEDTRSCAAERFWVLPPDLAVALERLERPAAVGRLEEEHREAVEELLRRGLVVEHEGFLVSVVTWPALGLRLRRRRAEFRAAPARAGLA